MSVLVELPKDHQQVLVWQGTIMTQDQVPEFEQWMLEECGCRIKYLESVTTSPSPDPDSFGHLLGTGGRIDVIFSVHNDDVGRIALVRLKTGMRWLDDVYLAGEGVIYPKHVIGYCHWESVVKRAS